MRRPASQVITTALIVLVSLLASVAVTWLVPSLSAASVNMLFRFRGQLRAPDDIVIVAIDDASLQRIGKWPWPRSVMARALDLITEAHPQAVGLDVIYAEGSDQAEDQLLAEAIRRNGRVVLPAQLTEFETTESDLQGSSIWLLPLPDLRKAAAATGHAHADPDVDGVLRTVQLSKADDHGDRLWAFGLETLRVAEQIPPERIEELTGRLRLGRYEIDIQDEAERSTLPGVTIVRPNQMIINYLGPPRTFPYYSIADILDGKVPAATFSNKIVLIGAVAQTMGDTRITPFIHYGGPERESGMGMPGIEVHANIIETIRRQVWLNPRPDSLGFGVAFLVILSAAAAVRLLDGWRVILVLAAELGLVIFGSIYVFNHYFIIPPVVPMLTGYLTVVPLLLLNSSITASRDLDRKLDRLANIQQRFLSRRSAEDSFSAPLSLLGAILKSEQVAFYPGTSSGRDASPATAEDGETSSEDSPSVLRVSLADDDGPLGVLVARRDRAEPFSEGERKLARAFGEALAEGLRASGQGRRPLERSLGLSLPRNIGWKLRAVDDITAHLVARISFMNSVFTSMTEGLLVADTAGQVVAANPAALALWSSLEAGVLTGQSLTTLFVESGVMDMNGLSTTVREVVSGRSLLMEVEWPGAEGRFCTLQFSAVLANDRDALPLNGSQSQRREDSSVIGLIVIINDVTKRRELERVKAETLQLVSHELRAPLTSIRGLSEALLKYKVPQNASPEIIETIYSESVRLSELINRYLDVTRIESGSQPLTRRPTSVNSLISECARVLGSLAAGKRMRITLKLEEPSPVVLADPQLLTQAVGNLLNNAVKYSPAGSEVEIASIREGDEVCIRVRDEGYGIPEEFQSRVFEKFYRLERDMKSEVVGTGLGLPLVKEIIERHGGQITLSSELDQGSTFTLHLPIQKA